MNGDKEVRVWITFQSVSLLAIFSYLSMLWTLNNKHGNSWSRSRSHQQLPLNQKNQLFSKSLITKANRFKPVSCIGGMKLSAANVIHNDIAMSGCLSESPFRPSLGYQSQWNPVSIYSSLTKFPDTQTQTACNC